MIQSICQRKAFPHSIQDQNGDYDTYCMLGEALMQIQVSDTVEVWRLSQGRDKVEASRKIDAPLVTF